MKNLKIFLILGLVILLISGNFGCKTIFGPEDDPTENGNNGTETCQYPLQPPAGKVGDTIRSCHFEVTLNWAKYDPIEYRGPRVTVHATIKLVKLYKGAGASIYADCFSIESGQGNLYKYNGLREDDALPQTVIGEGQTISGTSTITVDKDSSNFTAIFQESQYWQTTGYKDKIKWKLEF